MPGMPGEVLWSRLLPAQTGPRLRELLSRPVCGQGHSSSQFTRFTAPRAHDTQNLLLARAGCKTVVSSGLVCVCPSREDPRAGPSSLSAGFVALTRVGGRRFLDPDKKGAPELRLQSQRPLVKGSVSYFKLNRVHLWNVHFSPCPHRLHCLMPANWCPTFPWLGLNPHPPTPAQVQLAPSPKRPFLQQAVCGHLLWCLGPSQLVGDWEQVICPQLATVPSFVIRAPTPYGCCESEMS